MCVNSSKLRTANLTHPSFGCFPRFLNSLTSFSHLAIFMRNCCYFESDLVACPSSRSSRCFLDCSLFWRFRLLLFLLMTAIIFQCSPFCLGRWCLPIKTDRESWALFSSGFLFRFDVAEASCRRLLLGRTFWLQLHLEPKAKILSRNCCKAFVNRLLFSSWCSSSAFYFPHALV